MARTWHQHELETAEARDGMVRLLREAKGRFGGPDGSAAAQLLEFSCRETNTAGFWSTMCGAMFLTAREAIAPGSRSPLRDWVELSVGCGLVLTACWTPIALQRPLLLVTFAWLIGALVTAREDWKQMGLRLMYSVRSLWMVGITLVVCGIAFVIAARVHTLHAIRAPFWSHVSYYLLWAFVQQVILQDLLLLRLLRLLPTKHAAVGMAALIFASTHLPNPALTLLTLIWGLLACMLFLRYRGLFVLGLVHGLLGLCVATAIPDGVNHEMRVGLSYLTHRPACTTIIPHSPMSVIPGMWRGSASGRRSGSRGKYPLTAFGQADAGVDAALEVILANRCRNCLSGCRNFNTPSTHLRPAAARSSIRQNRGIFPMRAFGIQNARRLSRLSRS